MQQESTDHDQDGTEYWFVLIIQYTHTQLLIVAFSMNCLHQPAVIRPLQIARWPRRNCIDNFVGLYEKLTPLPGKRLV